MRSNSEEVLFFIYTASMALIFAGCGRYLPVQPKFELPVVLAFNYGLPLLILPLYLLSDPFASSLTNLHLKLCVILSGISIILMLFRFVAFVWRHV